MDKPGGQPAKTATERITELETRITDAARAFSDISKRVEDVASGLAATRAELEKLSDGNGVPGFHVHLPDGEYVATQAGALSTVMPMEQYLAERGGQDAGEESSSGS